MEHEFVVEAHLVFTVRTDDQEDIEHESIWLERLIEGIESGELSAVEDLATESVALNALAAVVAMTPLVADTRTYFETLIAQAGSRESEEA